MVKRCNWLPVQDHRKVWQVRELPYPQRKKACMAAAEGRACEWSSDWPFKGAAHRNTGASSRSSPTIQPPVTARTCENRAQYVA